MNNPPLRVVVVGAGIVGLAVGEALCRRGVAVTVLERDTIAAGTTGTSFAWLNATSKSSDKAYHQLNATGLAAWRDRARESGEGRIGLYPRGMIEWVDGENSQAAVELDKALTRLKSWDYPVHAVDRAELGVLEPHFNFPPNARGLYAIGDAALDAPRAAMYLAECIRCAGGEIFEQRSARGLRRNNGKLSAVDTDDGPVPAELVVVAAGYESNAVLATLTGVDQFLHRGPVGAVPGALLWTPPATPFKYVRHVVYCEHHGPLHLQPAPAGGLLLGGDDTDEWVAHGHDEAVLSRVEAHLLNRARKLIPTLPAEEWRGKCQVRVGIRAMPADGHSVVGELPGAPGVFLAATHSGVTLAPAIGALLAERIVSGNQPALLAPFSPQRFQSPGTN